MRRVAEVEPRGGDAPRLHYHDRLIQFPEILVECEKREAKHGEFAPDFIAYHQARWAGGRINIEVVLVGDVMK